MTGSNLFPNASAWVKAYTALSANVFPSLFYYSAYPQCSGERYRTDGPLVYVTCNLISLLMRDWNILVRMEFH